MTLLMHFCNTSVVDCRQSKAAVLFFQAVEYLMEKRRRVAVVGGTRFQRESLTRRMGTEGDYQVVVSVPAERAAAALVQEPPPRPGVGVAGFADRRGHGRGALCRRDLAPGGGVAGRGQPLRNIHPPGPTLGSIRIFSLAISGNPGAGREHVTRSAEHGTRNTQHTRR